MNNSIYELIIEKTGGNLFRCYGEYDDLKQVIDAWVEFGEIDPQIATNYIAEASKVRLLNAHSNEASRKSLLIAFQFSEVTGMVLEEY